MPIITNSSYHPPFFLRNGHLQTIWPVLFRRHARQPALWRTRLDTPDGDFIDVDHIPACAGMQAPRVAILSHGLEGNSTRRYMLGMAQALNLRGWDILARNFRGCSGEPNRLLQLYHGGETDDLDLTVQYAVQLGYESIALIGFSMGGNQTLKYLGEGRSLPGQIHAAVGISVPCDMEGSAERLSRFSHLPYMHYFLRTLRGKVLDKHARFPDRVTIDGLDHIHTFNAFDERYTAPIHGFASARDYWRKSGCLRFLKDIAVPFLLINAADDPFLSPGCYPRDTAQRNPAMTLEIPRWGGHVGFVTPGRLSWWAETRAADFLSQACGKLLS